jgi:GNAT superfamily N-acetyltransferase
MFLRELYENNSNEVAIIFGRFNPPHKGHRAAWEIASKSNAWFVGTNKSTQGPKDPLPFDVKVEAMKTIWPEVKSHIMPETSWLTMASKVYEKFPDATLLCLTDEEWVTKTIKDYNGKEGPHGFYNFKNIEQRPTPRLSSATALRDAVVKGDRKAFSQAAGVSADTKVAGKPFFDLVAEYLLPYQNAPKKVAKKKEPVAAEGIFDIFKDKPLPTKPETVKLGNFTVELEPSNSYIGFAWRDSSGREHYEEVSTVGNEFSANTRKELISKIKDEIKYQERQLKKQIEGSNRHISPSGVKTNMDPSDDDYDINYGKNGLVAKFRKTKGVAEGAHWSDAWEPVEDIKTKTGKVVGMVVRHDNGTYAYYDERKGYLESGFSSASQARQAFVELHNARIRSNNPGVAEGSEREMDLDWHYKNIMQTKGLSDKAKKQTTDIYNKLKKKKQQGVAEGSGDDSAAKAAHLAGLRHGREGVGNNMDRAKKEWGDDFKHYNAGFLKGRNQKAKNLKAVGQGYGKRQQGVAEGTEWRSPGGSTVDDLERAVIKYKKDLMNTSGDGTRGWPARIRAKIAELQQLIAQGKAYNEKQGGEEGYNDVSVGDYVSYDDGPGTDRWEVVSIEGNRVELRNNQGGTTFADINDVLKEQSVEEGSPVITTKIDGNDVYGYVDGVPAGMATFEYDRERRGWYSDATDVDPEYQRMGVATAIYNAAREKYGRIVPSYDQTPDAEALWKNKKVWEQGAAKSLNEFAPQGSGDGNNGDADLYDLIMQTIEQETNMFEVFGRDAVDSTVSDMFTMGHFKDIDINNDDDIYNAVEMVGEILSQDGVAEGSLGEVSKDTLDRYVTKAVDAHGHADFAARMSKDDPTLRSYHKDQKRTAEKRRQGISRALDRMSRQESFSKEKIDTFHTELDKLVHSMLGSSSQEKAKKR